MIRVCSFESRRGEEMRSLIERAGGEATIAPSMKEVPLGESAPVFDFSKRLLAGEFDIFIFLTGVGARALLEATGTRHPLPEIVAAINRTRVIIRGPKPVPVLKDAGVRIDIRAPEPNTWREILSAIDQAGLDVAGKRIALQEYGASSPDLVGALEGRGATVESVTVYRWSLPDDTNPLRDAIKKTIAGGFDGLLFTSAQQAHHVLEVAGQDGMKEAWLEAARRCIIGSIGPTASETLAQIGLPPDLEPEHGKMGHLVRHFFEAGPALAKWPK